MKINGAEITTDCNYEVKNGTITIDSNNRTITLHNDKVDFVELEMASLSIYVVRLEDKVKRLEYQMKYCIYSICGLMGMILLLLGGLYGQQ